MERKVTIRSTKGGSSLLVRVQPGAKKNRVNGVHDGALKVAVTAPPEHGKANDALVKFLAKSVGCKPKQVEILQGLTDRRKVFEFKSMSSVELEKIIESLLVEASQQK